MHPSLLMLLLAGLVLIAVLVKNLIDLLWEKEADGLSLVDSIAQPVREFWREGGAGIVVPFVAGGVGLLVLWWPFPGLPAMPLSLKLAQAALGLGATLAGLRYASLRLDEYRAARREKFWEEHDAQHQRILEMLQREMERNRVKAEQQERQRVPPTPRPAVPGWGRVLGLATPTNEREVQLAYRALAKQRHPDSGGSDKLMQELNQARDQALEWLRKPVK